MVQRCQKRDRDHAQHYIRCVGEIDTDADEQDREEIAGHFASGEDQAGQNEDETGSDQGMDMTAFKEGTDLIDYADHRQHVYGYRRKTDEKYQ